MYPKIVKETNFKLSIIDIIDKFKRIIFTGINIFTSGKYFVSFIIKSFHF